jgi:uncharacterized protein (DUF2336 family)
MVAIALLAALLSLVAAVCVAQLASTSGVSVERPAISADRGGKSSFTRDPYINRHAELVARYSDSPLMSQDGARGSSLARDPAIERHAEINARHNRGDLR